MKKTLITLAILSSVGAALAQGTLQIGNTFGTGTTGFRAPIYGLNPANPAESLSGNSAIGTPAGTTQYAGPLLQGTGFTFALFAGPAGTAEGALQLVTTTTFRTATGNVLPAGLINTVTVPINGVPSGSPAAVQVRVWDNQGGAISTWSQAIANPAAVASGKSGVFATLPLGGPDPGGGTPITPPEMRGWQSFNVSQVPEPSVIALGALGLGALLLRRRKS
jgi:hypothetical protein